MSYRPFELLDFLGRLRPRLSGCRNWPLFRKGDFDI